TGFQIIPLFGASAFFDLHQAGLQLNAIHTAPPKPLSHQYTAIFKSAGALRRSRSYRSVRSPPDHSISFQHYDPKLATRCLRFAGRFGPIHLKQIAQLHTRLVELRLTIADRATDDG